MKDHEFGKLHNDLRDTAKKYHGAEQLRSRLSSLVYPLEQEIKALQAQLDTAEKERDELGQQAVGYKSAFEASSERGDSYATACEKHYTALLAEQALNTLYLTTLTSIAESQGGYACSSCQTKIEAAQAAVGKGGAG